MNNDEHHCPNSHGIAVPMHANFPFPTIRTWVEVMCVVKWECEWNEWEWVEMSGNENGEVECEWERVRISAYHLPTLALFTPPSPLPRPLPPPFRQIYPNHSSFYPPIAVDTSFSPSPSQKSSFTSPYCTAESPFKGWGITGKNNGHRHCWTEKWNER